MKNVIVRGSEFNASTFSAKFKAYRGSVAAFAELVEGAGKQAAFNSNFDWINRLFEQAENNDLIKTNGDLSVKGKAAKAYIVFHTPCIKIERHDAGKHAGAWRASFTKSDKYRGSIAASVDDNGQKVMSNDPAADFAFDFKAWTEKAKKPSSPKVVKAETLKNRIGEMLKAFDVDAESPIDSDIVALRELQVMAEKLANAANVRWATIVAESAKEVDVDQAHAVAGAKPQASKRAGNAGK